MTEYVLDASALLRFLDREPGFDRIAALLKQATRGGIRLLVSAVNWGEVVSVLCRAHGLSAAKATASKLRALPLEMGASRPVSLHLVLMRPETAGPAARVAVEIFQRRRPDTGAPGA